ncbi:MAG: hypothetical protein AAFV07_02265 [Bacteroidota bacterium]
MIQTARILYLIFAIVMPTLVGILHTQAHFQYLTTPEAEASLQVPIILFGATTKAFPVWGLMSFMMGYCFILISALNFLLYRKLPKSTAPELAMYLVMFAYLGAVIYVGALYHAVPQLYGGWIGLGMLGISLLLGKIKRTRPNQLQQPL